MKKFITTGTLLIFCVAMIWAAVPSTIDDFHLAGTQPNQVTIEGPKRCGNCHGGYDPEVEIYEHWQGSMMAQAMRDPLFEAFVTIANQDAHGSGDLCIRCHTPEGWLEGRSTPTDGSSLTIRDYEGITCDFCHSLVKPSPLGVNPYPDDPDYTAETYAVDQADLAQTAEIPPQSGNGMYVVSSQRDKRGPFVDAKAKHKMLYSPFHSEAALCGTCHDVSNPAFDRQPDNTYLPNEFGFKTPSYNTYEMYPIERTYSEWLMSDYNTPEGVPSTVFGGNKANVSTCQDCHMRDVTGVGCNKRGVPIRDDLPLHDLTGGNTFVPLLVGILYPDAVNQVDLEAGIQRATAMLQSAATIEVSYTASGADYSLNVHLINETGHKLPSGYPEGRRIWISVKAYDSADNLVYESGAYDLNTGVLTHDADVKIYEIEPGISENLSSALGLPAGPSFHFVLNHAVFKDNRIPPRGFTNENFENIQSPPVAYTYADGQYWDDTQYLIPGSTSRIDVVLYYQTTTKEFIEFLRDENHTDDKGQLIYDLWNNNGKAAPVAMNSATINLTPPVTIPPVADFAANLTSGFAPLSVNFTDLSTNSPSAWLWNFGDGGSSSLQNPTYIYSTLGVYTVSLTATNSFGSDTKTKIDYISVEELTVTEMHVESIVVTRIAGKGNKFFAEALVTVFDQDGAPLSGAIVSADYTGPNSGSVNGTTDASGVAILTTGTTRNPSGEWCFTVTDISHGTDIYNPSVNIVTTACESGPVSRVIATFPNGFGLAQNYPNPFNPSTDINFRLPNATYVTLEVYNVNGQKVSTLVNSFLSAGNHTYQWNGSNSASGIYIYRLQAGELLDSKKMTLLK